MSIKTNAEQIRDETVTGENTASDIVAMEANTDLRYGL